MGWDLFNPNIVRVLYRFLFACAASLEEVVIVRSLLIFPSYHADLGLSPLGIAVLLLLDRWSFGWVTRW